jgi:hypothetical protein
MAAIEAETEPGWGRAAAQNVERLGIQAQVGDFVWTRDTHGCYLLCRLTGHIGTTTVMPRRRSTSTRSEMPNGRLGP